MGSSSGGHLALLGAVRPTPVTVRAVAALWPPVDPLGRHRFAQRQLETVDEGRLRQLYVGLSGASPAYFGSEEVMASASIARIVRAGEAEALPPVYVARASNDTNVPAEMLDELADAWRGAGGELTLSDFPDAPHAFGHLPSTNTDRLLPELTAFFAANL
jgi:acetyl esterase/lipase